MEEKLLQAAEKLPEPKSAFRDAQAVRVRKKARRTPRRRLAVLMVLALLLVGCVASSATGPKYQLINASWVIVFPQLASLGEYLSHELGLDLAKLDSAGEDLGYIFPRTLGDSPFIGTGQYNLTDQEVPYIWAMVAPRYVYYDANYGYPKQETSILEDGSRMTHTWTEAAVSLTFGSTEDEIWRRQFYFTEENVFTYTDKYYPIIHRYTLEYGGYTLYGATVEYDSDFNGKLSQYGQHLAWVDLERGVVFKLYTREDNTDFIIQCAKEFIDLNAK